MGKRWTVEEIEELKQLINANISVEQIAIKLNRTKKGIQEKRKKLGIPSNTPLRDPSNIYKNFYTDEEVEKLKQMNEEGKSQDEIAEALDRSKHSVNRKMSNMGIKTKRHMLWDIKELRPYVNKENAKELSSQSNKPITVTCPECKTEKEMKVQHLVNRGMSCLCTAGVSYGALAFNCYQIHFKLGFKSEKRIEGLTGRICDFVNFNTFQIVEVMGLQHYQEVNNGSTWKDAYKKSVESDKAKRDFANNPNNPYSLIEIDMRKSTWNHFKESIANEPLLPNITPEDEKTILKLMENSKRYDMPLIKKLYVEEEMSAIEVGKHLNLTSAIILRQLKKFNIEIRKGNFYQ